MLKSQMNLTFSRNASLQAKLAKCSVYEQFLMKVLDQLPEGTARGQCYCCCSCVFVNEWLKLN